MTKYNITTMSCHYLKSTAERTVGTVNPLPCVHISGQWEASSTHYRPPWWPVGGEGFPKGTQLEKQTEKIMTDRITWGAFHLWFTAGGKIYHLYILLIPISGPAMA